MFLIISIGDIPLCHHLRSFSTISLHQSLPLLLLADPVVSTFATASLLIIRPRMCIILYFTSTQSTWNNAECVMLPKVMLPAVARTLDCHPGKMEWSCVQFRIRVDFEKKWPALSGRPSLKWAPGKTYMDNEVGRRNIDHFTHRVPICV